MDTNVIAKIIERDYAFGKLCSEAQNSYEQKNYFSALACLFILSEQIIKFSVNQIDVNFTFCKAIKEAKEKDLISDIESQFIDFLRKIRNEIFHENHYPNGLKINGKFWSYSDDETKELIYKEFSPKIFKLIFKLITQ